MLANFGAVLCCSLNRRRVGGVHVPDHSADGKTGPPRRTYTTISADHDIGDDGSERFNLGAGGDHDDVRSGHPARLGAPLA